MNEDEKNMIPSDNRDESSSKLMTSEPAGKIGFSITAMVCGILSLVLCCLGLLSVILGIVAISFSAVSLKRNYAGRGMAIAGMACGVTGIGIYLLYILYLWITGMSLATLLS